MKSKLFTPELHVKRGEAAESEPGGFFVNPPNHPDINVFSGPTGTGAPCHPLRLSGSGSASTNPMGSRGVRSRRHIDY